MISEYHRPETLEEALRLLERDTVKTVPMGGGTVLNAPSANNFAVVDLQNLGLDGFETHSGSVWLGAATTLQRLIQAYETKEVEIPEALIKAAKLEATYNLRQIGTIAGTLVTSDGRSPFAMCMLALDCRVQIYPEDEVSLGNLLNSPGEYLEKKLILRVGFPQKVRLAYHYVARSPADQPIVGVAVSKWSSDRVRVVVGGFGLVPRLVVDASPPTGIEAAIKNACAHAEDQWASAEYRENTATVLVKRAIAELA